MSETIVNSAQIGLRSLYYAKLLSEDATEGVTYDTPKEMAPAIDAKITPKVTSASIYGSDMKVGELSNLTEVDIELQTTDLPLEIIQDLLGHTLDATKGVQIYDKDDPIPIVAIGFKSQKANGKYRYVWLLKGKFSEVEDEFKSISDNISPTYPNIKGVFYARVDGKWRYTADEDSGYTGGDAGWFTNVYKPAEA